MVGVVGGMVGWGGGGWWGWRGGGGGCEIELNSLTIQWNPQTSGT